VAVLHSTACGPETIGKTIMRGRVGAGVGGPLRSCLQALASSARDTRPLALRGQRDLPLTIVCHERPRFELVGRVVS